VNALGVKRGSNGGNVTCAVEQKATYVEKKSNKKNHFNFGNIFLQYATFHLSHNKLCFPITVHLDFTKQSWMKASNIPQPYLILSK
jgi:hypothetical protein